MADAKQSEIDRYVAAEARKVGSELQAFLKDIGLTDTGWSFHIEEGDPYDVIASVAKRTEADLILIGTRGRSGFAKLLLGSVAEQVLRRLDFDILALPAPRSG